MISLCRCRFDVLVDERQGCCPSDIEIQCNQPDSNSYGYSSDVHEALSQPIWDWNLCYRNNNETVQSLYIYINVSNNSIDVSCEGVRPSPSLPEGSKSYRYS
jgi:hypothetical protein